MSYWLVLLICFPTPNSYETALLYSVSLPLILQYDLGINVRIAVSYTLVILQSDSHICFSNLKLLIQSRSTPPAFRRHFKHGTQIHSHYTRNAKDYRSSHARPNTRLLSLKHVGTSIWNKMPSNFRLAPYLLKFIKLLKASVIDDGT